MSYDVFLQGFEDGDGSQRDRGQDVRSIITSALGREEPDHDFVHLLADDGSAADVYGVTHSTCIDHGPDVQLHQGAGHRNLRSDGGNRPSRQLGDPPERRAYMLGLRSESQRQHLPPVLAEGRVLVVERGTDVANAIRQA